MTRFSLSVSVFILTIAAGLTGCEYANYETIPFKGASADETPTESAAIEPGDEGWDELLKKIAELEDRLEGLNQPVVSEEPEEPSTTPEPAPDPKPTTPVTPDPKPETPPQTEVPTTVDVMKENSWSFKTGSPFRKTDIVLTGHSGWKSVPVAFSKGDGTFDVSNFVAEPDFVNPNVGAFAVWAATPGVALLTGDFDGDGKTDITLVGLFGSFSLPVAFSKGDGTFKVTNALAPSFAAFAQAPGAEKLAGDFNGDGKTDIALTGTADAEEGDTLGVALSKGDGTFQYTAESVGDFAAWSNAAMFGKLTGDFNGDGKTDIALTGVSGWNTLPVAFSKGDGTFRITNRSVGDFAAWAATAEKVTGDFNGDGKTDIALTGNKDWNTLPVAFSNGDGTFRVTNYKITNTTEGDFAVWAADPEAARLTGDFDGDGKTDIALSGPSEWSTLPVAFSKGDGTFEVMNKNVGDFAGWAAVVEKLTGDFNGDGKTDIALTGGSGWTTLPVAFSNGRDGTFKVTNLPVGDFAGWAVGTARLTGKFK